MTVTGERMSGSSAGNGELDVRGESKGEARRLTPDEGAKSGKSGGCSTGNVLLRMKSLNMCAKCGLRGM